MTSTEFTVGMGEGRNSSKVLKPPGGGCSDIFGVQGNQQQQSHKQENTQNRLFGTTTEPVTPSKTNRMKSNIFGGSVETNVPKSNSKKFIQRNPITGEITEIDLKAKDDETVDENGKVEENGGKVEQNGNKVEENGDTKEENFKAPAASSVRVKQPPGGKSSGIF